MNERIRELAEHAWDSARDEIGSFVDEGGEVNWGFFHTYDKKFAELIVQECASIVNSLEQYEGRGDCSTAEYIKEHFGVE